MPVLAANVTVPSREPILLVENRLRSGIHVFSLTVVDNAGNESRPALLSVTVLPAGRGGTGSNFTDLVRDFINPVRPLRPEG